MSRTEILSRKQHRKAAVALFNDVWRLLEKTNRTAREELLMIHEAHASRYHWNVVGTPKNLAIGEWQISRVYAVLGHGEAAKFHANASLEVCRRNGLKDFTLAYAYEALARAAAVSRAAGDRERFLHLARRAGAKIRASDDRELFLLRDLATIPPV
ncbi:MAG TPA: hypothetical protein VIL58_05275 [Thermoplasmata archaeon]